MSTHSASPSLCVLFHCLAVFPVRSVATLWATQLEMTMPRRLSLAWVVAAITMVAAVL